MSANMSQQLIDEAAANWDVRLRSHRCTAEDRAEFNRWLTADARHQGAYERLQRGLAALRSASNHPQLQALREIASLAERRAQTRHRVLTWVATAAGIAIVALAIGTLPWHPQALQVAMPETTSLLQHSKSEVLATSTTERRTVSLQDGTSVTLDSSTRVETEWLVHERRIRLLSGRALFRVAKDKTRPFIVTVGDRTVTALGTVFDIRLGANKVQVTLLEGRVAVRGVGQAANQPTQELAPNQQLLAFDDQPAIVKTVNGIQESAWADGQVYFVDEPLSVAVAEMNQHSVLQLVIADPALSKYRLSGMFRVGNQDGFVTAITTYFPIDALPDGAGHIVLRAQSKQASSQ